MGGGLADISFVSRVATAAAGPTASRWLERHPPLSAPTFVPRLGAEGGHLGPQPLQLAAFILGQVGSLHARHDLHP